MSCIQRLIDHVPPATSVEGDLTEKDLNKVSEEELLDYKRRMDAKFEENRLKPGDLGYIYDKQVRNRKRINNSH